MDNEKYGIELELITNKFKQKMQEVKGAFGSLSKEKTDLSKQIKIDNLYRQLEIANRQTELLMNKFDQLKAKKDAMFEWQRGTAEYTNLSAQLQQVGLQMQASSARALNLKDKINLLETSTNKVSKSATKMGTSFNKGIDKMTSKIKRFGLALVGLRSIWALVSRASSAYLSQDTELADKLQAAWIGLGSILAPIINFIATLMLKLVSIVNMVIKALTGVDLIAKASAKSMKGAAGSANSLKKALAGFDELQNLDTDAGGGAGAGVGFGDYFKDIDTDWSEMVRSFYDTIDKIALNGVKKIQDEKNKAVKIMSDMGWSNGVINAYSTMMDGIAELWEGLILVVKGVVEIIDGILSLDAQKIWKGFIDLMSGIGDIIMGVVDLVVGFIDFLVSAILDGVVMAAKWFYEKLIKPVINWFKDLWAGIKELAINIGTKLGEVISTAFVRIINSVLSAIERILNSPIRAINRLTDVINKVPGINLGKLNTFSLPRLDVGTNYVPQDQLAMIHKGEAVIPKKFNSQQYFGGTNDETNELLQQLITRVENIELNPYITVKDIGKASLSYINNKSRQLGESVVV